MLGGILFRWQINALMTVPEKEVKYFPPVKNNPITVIILILIGLALLVSMGFIFKDRIESVIFQDPPLNKRSQPVRVSGKPPSPTSAQKANNSTEKLDTPKKELSSITKKLTNEDLSRELKRINHLITLDNQNADAFYNRGWIYEHKGEFEKAVKDYTRALTIDKSQTDAYYNRGLIYLVQGKYSLAIADFTEVIKQKREDADVYNNRGNAYMKINEFESALNDYNTAINLSPDDPDLYYNRGIVYRHRGEHRKSRQDFQKAADMGHKKARELLGLPAITEPSR